jgi:hypothetical protein
MLPPLLKLQRGRQDFTDFYFSFSSLPDESDETQYCLWARDKKSIQPVIGILGAH